MRNKVKIGKNVETIWPAAPVAESDSTNPRWWWIDAFFFQCTLSLVGERQATSSKRVSYTCWINQSCRSGDRLRWKIANISPWKLFPCACKKPNGCGEKRFCAAVESFASEQCQRDLIADFYPKTSSAFLLQSAAVCARQLLFMLRTI